MPITAPPDIPLITDPATFATRAQDWVVWQSDELYPALEEESLLLGLSLSGTSVTSNLIGTGSKSFTTQTGKGFAPGQSLVIARTSAPTNRMFVVVTSYNSVTGALVVTSQTVEGSGTFTDWTISPSFSAIAVPADLSVTNAKLAQQYINDLTAVEFDYGNDFVPVADGSDSGNKKKVYLSESTIIDVDASVEANALTVTINPCTLHFRSTTLTDGSPSPITSNTAKTVTVPSGGTLGTTNGNIAKLAILAINNAGTLEAAIVNVSNGINLDESGLITTIAVGTGSDSAGVVYSTTARSNVAYRVIGYIDITEATAGTWATAPSLVQGFGGLSFKNFNLIILGTPVTASGTAVDFTGIPSWVKRITVMFSGVSLNGSSDFLIQVGDSGGIENTGYVSQSLFSTNVSSSTSGFVIRSGAASYVFSGHVVILNLSPNVWVESHTLTGGSNVAFYGGGDKSLSATLDRIRITTVNGTDTFDAGSINILYE
jgi:hypothetical protein